MADIILAGTIGLDDIETPFGKAKEVLGGSSVYAAYAASFFAKPAMVSIAGKDFPDRHRKTLMEKGICLRGVEIKGKNFRWEGLYEFDMNEAKTLRTELNSLTEFNPKLPEEYRKAKYLFLANVDPEVQLKVIEQTESPEFIAMDTMNFWIEHKKEMLSEVMKKVDVIILNDGEARQFFGTVNLITAANKALEYARKAVIIKKGEHGALLFVKEDGRVRHFNAPGYPLETIKDPTGCGDSFGGGFMGYIASREDTSDASLRKAVIYGSVMASFNAEDFSLERQKTLSQEEIEGRYKEMREIREF